MTTVEDSWSRDPVTVDSHTHKIVFHGVYFVSINSVFRLKKEQFSLS